MGIFYNPVPGRPNRALWYLPCVLGSVRFRCKEDNQICAPGPAETQGIPPVGVTHAASCVVLLYMRPQRDAYDSCIFSSKIAMYVLMDVYEQMFSQERGLVDNVVGI